MNTEGGGRHIESHGLRNLAKIPASPGLETRLWVGDFSAELVMQPWKAD